MANQVTGKNTITQILISGIWYPFFCGKTAELSANQDEIEVTHVNSGADREYVPGMSNHTISFAGVTVLDNTENRISWEYIVQSAQRRSIHSLRTLLTDQDGDQRVISYSAFFTSGTLSRDVTQWSQSSINMRITGALTFESPATPPTPPSCEIEDPIYTVLVEGAIEVTSALLIPGVGETITILHVTRSGVTLYETTGTPGNLEFRYVSVTGKIQFDPANPGLPPFPDNEPVSIEYKIEV